MDLQLGLIPRLAALVIRAIHATLRIRHVSVERIEALNREARGYIMAFWHAHLLLMVYAQYRKPITAVISQHRDGELIARTMMRFGALAARGSTTRGGFSALRDVIRIASSGRVVAITPDGPRGPRRVAQIGAIASAQAAQVPIIPVAFVAKKKSF
jgi:lysophospholipid acyltransferase (LPLAT)-like uncharacterized protein